MRNSIVVVTSLFSIFVANSAIAESPAKQSLTGKWLHTSFLLDPGSITKADPLPTSVASIWAVADVTLTETPAESGTSKITGTLAFKGLAAPLSLEIVGRRITRGGTDRFIFTGTGQRPRLPTEAGTGPIKLEYELRGTWSAAWPPKSKTPTLRGYIRNVEGDPYCAEGVGAFVLVAADSASVPTEN